MDFVRTISAILIGGGERFAHNPCERYVASANAFASVSSMATRNNMQPFAAGQVWTYNTRSGEEASRIVICRVETDSKLGEIVHIHINGLRLKNERAPGGSSDEIGHMPYSAAALCENLTMLESTAATLPAYEGGYQEWRSAFDSGEAGVWTASVSKAIDATESALNQ